MRLAAYSSTAADTPNLVGLQDEGLTALPTVLVCPLKAGIAMTALRVGVPWARETLVACPELARPIRRSALALKGWINEPQSTQIINRLKLLLAR